MGFSFTSAIAKKPQENQYQGDTPSSPDNSTGWMQPNSPMMGGGSSEGQSSGTPTPIESSSVGGNTSGQNAGTALGSLLSGNGNTGFTGGAYGPGMIGGGGFSPQAGSSWMQPSPQSNAQPSGGNVGQYMPEGYDTGKFSDTANANSTKYQVGRILSQYPPGPEGLQQAAGELARLGISVQGRDKIRLPDGTTTDVGKSFSDPNANHAWQYNWSGPLDSGGGQSSQGGFSSQGPMGMQQGSMLGMNGQQNQQQGQAGMLDPQMMQQLIQMMQQQQGNPLGNQRSKFDFSNANSGYNTGYDSLLNPGSGNPGQQLSYGIR